MNVYYEPVNLKQWNMFEKVSGVGHVESFLAVASMSIGDIVLLHVGKQDKRYISGIYAYGRVIKGPYILEDSPEEYCNNKNTVDVEIIEINYELPLIDREITNDVISQFRTVHRLNEKVADKLLSCLQIRNMN